MARELLFSVTKKDLRVDTFKAGGKGGQKQNKTDSGVRITHIESGAVGESREARSQPENKRLAFRRMVESPKFESWRRRKASELMLSRAERKKMEELIDRRVREAMAEENIQTEVMGPDGNWTPEG